MKKKKSSVAALCAQVVREMVVTTMTGDDAMKAFAV